eukprot:434604_1
MSSMLIHVVILFIIVLIPACYSKYYDEQSFTFIYHGNNTDLINITGLSLSILNDTLYIVYCNEKQHFPIKQNISYHLHFIVNKNILQLTLNQHILCKKTCLLTTNNLRNTNPHAMWITNNNIHSKHFRHLLTMNTTNSSIKSTLYKSKSQSYKWYEIWKVGWWVDQWTTTKYIIVIIICVIIVAFIIFITTCCICYRCKKSRKK